MILMEQTIFKAYTICILWGLYSVGLARCERSHELHEFKLVPSINEVVHFENDSYIVSCQANGTRLRWWNPKNKVVENTRGRIHIEERGNETALVFTSIGMHDKGNWTCEAEQGLRKISFNMIVYKPVSFVDTPNIQSVRENEEAFIQCMTIGDPEPSISWYYNGESLDLKNEKCVKLADGLSIKNVTKTDNGEYTCKAFQISSALSNVKEQTIRLNIQHKPIHPVRRQSVDVQYGYVKGNVNVTCDAVAEPPAHFQWYRNGKLLHPRENLIDSTDHSSVLQLYIHNASVFGEYVCEAENSLGNLTRTIKLKNGTKPVAPPHITLRGVNSNTFDLDVGAKRPPAGTNPDPMDVTGYRFELLSKEDHRNNGGKWTNARVVFKEFTDGVTYLVNNLSPNTSYLIRVASKNAAGLRDWMGPQEFHTHAKTPVFENSSSRPTTVFNSVFGILMYWLMQRIQFYGVY